MTIAGIVAVLGLLLTLAAVSSRRRTSLTHQDDIEGRYSIGGGNRAILDAFDARQRPCRAFIAHDLDRDNRQLLEAGRLSAVLYHDLRADMHRACQIIMQARRPARCLLAPSRSWPGR